MTDWSRLVGYIIDFFPEPKYNTKDVTDWAKENVPAWKHISSKEKKEITGEWEDFIQPKVEGRLRGFSKRFIGRIRKFLGRLF